MAGCFVCEIPVEGVHTKWFEDLKGLLAELRALKTGEKIADNDVFEACGPKRPPVFLRVRNARP